MSEVRTNKPATRRNDWMVEEAYGLPSGIRLLREEELHRIRKPCARCGHQRAAPTYIHAQARE